METKQLAENRLEAAVMNFDMQTGFFINALEGITDSDAHNRLGTKANHVAWLAGSLVQQRFELANILNNNEEMKQQADDLFRDNQGLKEDVTYPPLEQYKSDWEEISPIMQRLLRNADAQTLERIIEFPDMSFPVFDMIAFSTYREANHIGQIALWRRLLGYGPMKYM